MFSRRRTKPIKTFPLKRKINWEYYNPPESSSAAQFCLDSSLHGLQYVGQQNRHCFERLLWLAAFIGSVTCAGLLINQLWTAHANSPIVSEFYPDDLPLRDIAFPAITICNLNKVRLSKVREYVKQYYDTNNSDDKMDALLSLKNLENVCYLTHKNNLVKIIEKFDDDDEELKMALGALESGKNYSIINPSEGLANSAHECSRMVRECKLNKIPTSNCSKLFRPVMTDFGHCCTFNLMPLNLLLRAYNVSEKLGDVEHEVVNWNNDRWKKADITSDNLIMPPANFSLDEDPIFRQQYPSKLLGLEVELNPELNDYYCPTLDDEDSKGNGFLVGLHSSLEYPWMVDSMLQIQPETETFIKIVPQITIGDISIKQFPLKIRKCYFDDEVQQILSQHTKYSATNCLYECVSEQMLGRCGCIPFYNMSNPHDVNYCLPDEMFRCSHEVEQIGSWFLQCSHCYPSCTEIRYQADLTTIDNPKQEKELTRTTILFSFDQNMYQARLRKEKYTVIDLISSAGGLLGLCMGFSMLSLLEILYYGTIRLCCIYRRKYSQMGSSEGIIGLETSDDQLVQNPLTKLWSKGSRNEKNCKTPVFVIRRRSALSFK